jgi:hypothetical protein
MTPLAPTFSYLILSLLILLIWRVSQSFMMIPFAIFCDLFETLFQLKRTGKTSNKHCEKNFEHGTNLGNFSK